MSTRARVRTRYRCGECGAEPVRWLGRCPDCGQWGTVGEVDPCSAERPAEHRPLPLQEVVATTSVRQPTGIAELDRVLGGGLVPGSVTLLGGEPGIGKSTLLLQALGSMAGSGRRCLLVGAEESPGQVRLRAERLGIVGAHLSLTEETSVAELAAQVAAGTYDVLAVDSIQTVVDPDLPGGPGSVNQVRACATRLVRLAKDDQIATILVGHVTKDGALAGPRTLEHLVDTVLAFSGDRHQSLRFLRALKHRFGSTRELGVFAMEDEGLRGVPDPSRLFLADRCVGAAGSVVVPVVEGARPCLVEVQALVTPAVARDAPARRAVSGLDAARLVLLLAVLQRWCGLQPGTSDVYVSVTGGVRISETACDLGVALAVASAAQDQPIDPHAVVLGEVGLGGEVRSVARAKQRLTEAARLGFTRVIGPASLAPVDGLELVPVRTVAEALTVATQARHSFGAMMGSGYRGRLSSAASTTR